MTDGVGRPRGRLRAALVSTLFAAICRGSLRRGCLVGFPVWPSATSAQRRLGITSRRAEASPDDDTWKKAYELEVERNGLLREQFRNLGLRTVLLNSGEIDLDGEPEACVVDFAENYETLSACNLALEKALRGKRQGGPSFEDRRDVAARTPPSFKLKLNDQEGDAVIQLSRFFGLSSAFYALRAPLPLGLNLTKRESGGQLMGAFVVENVLPGGSAEASGKVLPGDVLQALTVVASAAGLGSRGSEHQEFLSTLIGGIQKPTQTLVGAAFMNTLEDLVDAFKTNTELGDDAELTMIFERDTDASPAPVDVLEPETES